MEQFKEFLMVIGMGALIAIIGGLLVGALSCVRDLIDTAKRRYQYKHRFDKPPTAKCYCVDCKFHDAETRRCYRFGETTKEYRCTADNWFCWEAEPYGH